MAEQLTEEQFSDLQEKNRGLCGVLSSECNQEVLSAATLICREQVGKYTQVLKHLLAPCECQHIINITEQIGLDRHRTNTRDQLLFRCKRLSQELASRLRLLIPPALQGRGGENGHTWEFAGISDVWRVTRYKAPADSLQTHFDEVKVEDSSCCSVFTLTIYLNTIANEQGGRTLFDSRGSTTAINISSLQPVVGSALLLDHGVLHSGECLENGIKYILRTEVLYRSGDSRADEYFGVGDLDDYEMQWPSIERSACCLPPTIIKYDTRDFDLLQS